MGIFILFKQNRVKQLHKFRTMANVIINKVSYTEKRALQLGLIKPKKKAEVFKPVEKKEKFNK